MIFALFGLVAFLASVVAALGIGAFIAAGKGSQRDERWKREMFRVLTARLVTDELGPGAELRALRMLGRDAVRADTVASNGDEPSVDEMVEQRRRSHARAVADGEVDDRGTPILPSGF